MLILVIAVIVAPFFHWLNFVIHPLRSWSRSSTPFKNHIKCIKNQRINQNMKIFITIN